MKLVGREKEIKELEKLYKSDKPEFVALFGRRRVGKTFLINEVFENKFAFKHTALSPLEDSLNNKMTTKMQLDNFKESLIKYGYQGARVISDWYQAFYALEELLESLGEGRKVVFIDELPWLDTYGANFVSAIDLFWNSWANCHDILFIICGSANAWMTKKMLNNYGGLYNRITYEIELLPLSLKECELFFKEKHILLSRYDIVQLYMTFGGIPFYLDLIDGNMSIGQNVQKLFFSRPAKLSNEFTKLFKSTFNNPDLIIKILKFMFTKKNGYTREEIIKGLDLKEGEATSDAFNALIASGYVFKYRPLIDNRKTLYYKICDPFTLFYLEFVNKEKSIDSNLFEHNYESKKISTWRGLSFENVCFNHVNEIKRALQIESIESEVYPFVYVEDGKIDSQIDLVIDRKDNIVNLCECKFYSDDYLLNKNDYLKLVRRSGSLSKLVKKKQVVRNALITTFGLKYNEYSSLFNSVITLDDLFR